MKKIIMSLTSLLIICGTAFANATFTDQLKQKYSDGDLYIEYEEVATHSGVVDARSERFVFAQKDQNRYYKHDYLVHNSWLNENRMIKESDAFTSLSILYSKENVLDWHRNHPYQIGGFRNYLCSDLMNNDVNVVEHEEGYFPRLHTIDRDKSTVFYIPLNTPENYKKAEKLMCREMIVPTIFNSILLTSDNVASLKPVDAEKMKKSITQPGKVASSQLIKAEKREVLGEMLDCEVYRIYLLNEFGMPKTEAWEFELYYKNGELKYFSNSISEVMRHKLEGKILEKLNVVNKLGKVEDKGLFNGLQNCKYIVYYEKE